MKASTEIHPDKVHSIEKWIVTATMLSSNPTYSKSNNIKNLVHWFQSKDATKLSFGSIEEIKRYRKLDLQDDLQPEITINKPDKFKAMN